MGGPVGASNHSKGAAACHRHALRLLGLARQQLLLEQASRGRAGPGADGAARELAHVCGRLAWSAFPLGQQDEGVAWLKEAAQQLLRASAARAGVSKPARQAEPEQAWHLQQEHDPFALARTCSSILRKGVE